MKCSYCRRQRPIFSGNDELTRLPDTALTQFLRQLKQDNLRKKRYLRTLRIAPKFIQPCNCGNKVHSYCLAARVIMTEKIYCARCNEYYRFYSSDQEKGIIASVIRYVLWITMVLLLAASVTFADGYVKCYSQNTDEALDSARIFTSQDNLNFQNTSVYEFFEQCVHLSALWKIEAIVVPIIIWSLYHSLNRVDSSERSSAELVEVLSVKDRTVTRHKAKQNLHKIRENEVRRRIENVLFDQFWYRNREIKQRRERVKKENARLFLLNNEMELNTKKEVVAQDIQQEKETANDARI